MEKKIVLAKIEVIKGKEDEFMSLGSPLIEATKAEPGNLGYSLYQDTNNSSQYLVYEEYINEQAFNEHCNSEHFNTFVQKTTSLFAKEIEIQVF